MTSFMNANVPKRRPGGWILATPSRPKDLDAGILRRRHERQLRELSQLPEASPLTTLSHERDIREWRAVWAEVSATTKTRR
jgi:hypothetical protein